MFDLEEQIIEQSECIIRDDQVRSNPLFEQYKELAGEYKRLFKQFARVLKISDRQQVELKESREAINRCNFELKIEVLERKKIEDELKIANAQLQQMAHLDGLTQIANRRYFDDYLKTQWGAMIRESAPLSLIMCDIDFFKRYNDTYGHPSGDECLIKVADGIRRAILRPTDLAARYGGEEFAVILPRTDIDGAMWVATRIHLEIKKLNIEHPKSPVGNQLSLSIGLSCKMPGNGDTPELLISEADQALYNAKAGGRNRIVIGSDGHPKLDPCMKSFFSVQRYISFTEI